MMRINIEWACVVQNLQTNTNALSLDQNPNSARKILQIKARTRPEKPDPIPTLVWLQGPTKSGNYALRLIVKVLS